MTQDIYSWNIRLFCDEVCETDQSAWLWLEKRSIKKWNLATKTNLPPSYLRVSNSNLITPWLIWTPNSHNKFYLKHEVDRDRRLLENRPIRIIVANTLMNFICFKINCFITGGRNFPCNSNWWRASLRYTRNSVQFIVRPVKDFQGILILYAPYMMSNSTSVTNYLCTKNYTQSTQYFLFTCFGTPGVLSSGNPTLTKAAPLDWSNVKKKQTQISFY